MLGEQSAKTAAAIRALRVTGISNEDAAKLKAEKKKRKKDEEREENKRRRKKNKKRKKANKRKVGPTVYGNLQGACYVAWPGETS